MATPSNCPQNTDPLKLIREGTDQDQRFPEELNPDKPAFPQVDERRHEHAMVFAKAYSKHLQFYGSNNTVTGNWEPFFSQDVSVQLAVAAVQDVEYYKATVKAFFDFLNNNENPDADLKTRLGYLFSTLSTLAAQLERLKEELPAGIALKQTLRNLIQNQLALALTRLIAYHKAFSFPDPDPDFANAQPGIVLLGEKTSVFSGIYSYNFSRDWIIDNADNWNNWNAYAESISPDDSVYGSSETVFERINHIATHNLFTSIFEQFLKLFARTVIEAKAELASTFTHWDNHEPHYALFLSFLRLFEYARAETNTLTQRHLDFYYREILKLKEKPIEPSHAHLLVELARHAGSHEIKADTLFKAGKDALGIDAYFASGQDFIANQAKVTELKTLYRHKATPDNTLPADVDRLFASPKADSADGLGAKLTTADQSWHPFFNKIYKDGQLSGIKMPQAEVGFAIASHYLWLAEGIRTITVDFTVSGTATDFSDNHNNEIICLITSEKGWFETPAETFKTASKESGILQLVIKLSGAAPAFTPYSQKTHGYDFSTNLPVLLVKLRHQNDPNNPKYLYRLVQDMVIETIDLSVDVNGLKSLAVSNDFGPVDTSKPFQPFGAIPIAYSGLVIGSKEIFQKTLFIASVNIKWQSPPAPYDPDPSDDPVITYIYIEYLQDGVWQSQDTGAVIGIDNSFMVSPGLDNVAVNTPGFQDWEVYKTDTIQNKSFSLSPDVNRPAVDAPPFPWPQWSQWSQWLPGIGRWIFLIPDNNIQNEYFILYPGLNRPVVDAPDFSEPELYTTSSRHGFVRFEIRADFGQSAYEQALIDYIRTPDNPKPVPPVGPYITEFSMNYTTAKQTIDLDGSDQSAFEKPRSRFFHLTPFGQCEQQRLLNPEQKVSLVPQFSLKPKDYSNAEFYIGLTGLKPPQNLALLFQAADGTADPLSDRSNIVWSYLSNNQWLDFAKQNLQDGTGGLRNSGIITFSIPDDASSANTLLPAGLHWLRAAVADKCDAVCKLLAVSAQGLTVTFQNQGNDPAYPAQTLPAETINKLDQPVAAVKKISQPFQSFGGRGAEAATAFYTRISERLRHKDRGIALWDYERLILEAFPQIYKAKCLNHTRYETGDAGVRFYNELAPGHVTLVTIPNQLFHNLRDPLKPLTSLGLLTEIEAFLSKRLSCFVTLHVKNPLFEEVRVNFKVKFYEGFDEIFYEKKLNQAITSFLSPWAFANDKRPSFGGKIYKSVLMNFIEEQPYVDYVTDFQLFHDLEDNPGAINKDEVEGSTAISILVSSRKHRINERIPGEL